MKDSQRHNEDLDRGAKYIKANNERFSTGKSFYIHGH